MKSPLHMFGRKPSMRVSITIGTLAPVLAALLIASPALAWNQAGHQTVGAIADALLLGTNAGKEIKKILGSTASLQTAALWADCAKGTTEKPPYHFVVSSRFPECARFQSAAGQKAMVSYVKRNLDACHPASDEEKCHRQYHYADVAIERDAYARTEIGTSDHDVVSAINAVVMVLEGKPAPTPFDIASKKEALRLLAHFVGDIHQPLHVGAIYLDAAGHEADPDSGAFDPSTKNHGGNLLMHGSQRLHGEWDDIPDSLKLPQFKSAGVAAAKLVPVTSGTLDSWPMQWATGTVLASHTAFQGLTFGAEVGAGSAHPQWAVTEQAGYAAARSALQQEQLVKAGARLAQLLEAIWP